MNRVYGKKVIQPTRTTHKDNQQRQAVMAARHSAVPYMGKRRTFRSDFLVVAPERLGVLFLFQDSSLTSAGTTLSHWYPTKNIFQATTLLGHQRTLFQAISPKKFKHRAAFVELVCLETSLTSDVPSGTPSQPTQTPRATPGYRI